MKVLRSQCAQYLRGGAVGLAALWVSQGALAQGFPSVVPPSFPKVVTPEVATQQQREIAALVTELDYLIDYVQRLVERYPKEKDTAPIRFNYGELLTQLRLTKNRAISYLNEAHGAVLHAPPPPRQASLTERY